MGLFSRQSRPPEDAPPPETRPTIFAQHFELEVAVANGPVFVVWRARDGRTGDRVALKFFPSELIRTMGGMMQARDVIVPVRRLQHPTLVPARELASNRDFAAFVTPWIDGGNLRQLRCARPSRCFELDDILPWTTALVDLMETAHAQGILHGSLSPLTLLDAPAGLRVIGFGINAWLRYSFHANFAQTVASDGTIFASPAIRRGEMPQPTDDVFSFGGVIYELLTGFPPGEDGPWTKNRPPPPMAKRRKKNRHPHAGNVPAAWETVVAACLEADPLKRPASFTEIRQRLGLARLPVIIAPVVPETSLATAELDRSAPAAPAAPALATAASATVTTDPLQPAEPPPAVPAAEAPPVAAMPPPEAPAKTDTAESIQAAADPRPHYIVNAEHAGTMSGSLAPLTCEIAVASAVAEPAPVEPPTPEPASPVDSAAPAEPPLQKPGAISAPEPVARPTDLPPEPQPASEPIVPATRAVPPAAPEAALLPEFTDASDACAADAVGPEGDSSLAPVVSETEPFAPEIAREDAPVFAVESVAPPQPAITIVPPPSGVSPEESVPMPPTCVEPVMPVVPEFAAALESGVSERTELESQLESAPAETSSGPIAPTTERVQVESAIFALDAEPPGDDRDAPALPAATAEREAARPEPLPAWKDPALFVLPARVPLRHPTPMDGAELPPFPRATTSRGAPFLRTLILLTLAAAIAVGCLFMWKAHKQWEEFSTLLHDVTTFPIDATAPDFATMDERIVTAEKQLPPRDWQILNDAWRDYKRLRSARGRAAALDP